MADERHRKAHLMVDVQTVEKALLARADLAGEHLAVARRQARAHGLPLHEPLVETVAATVAEIIGSEFRALAEELHYQ